MRRQQSTGKRAWAGRAGLACLLGFALLLASGCSGVFFHPTREHIRTPQLAAVDITDVYFDSLDGVRLHAWLVKPETDPPRGTILFFHGNAENVSTHVHSALWLVEAGYQLFIFDYRGYGKSDEKPGVEGVHLDGMAALEHVFSRGDVDPDRVVVLGQSLGGAIALTTVSRSTRCDDVRLLIADSAFSGYRRIFREKLGGFFLTWPLQYPLSYLVSDGQSPERWLHEKCSVPVLFVHGDRDRVVPISHSERMFGMLEEPKGMWTVSGAAHIQGMMNGELRATLLEKLGAILSRGAEGDPAPDRAN